MRIAIVDDEKYFLDLLKQTLESALISCGLSDTVIDCYHSAEGIMEAFKADAYQLIFLDIYMGEKTGVDAAAYIRERDPNVMIVFCTTSNDFASQSYELNVNYYLRKPLSQESILKMLERLQLAKLKAEQTITLPDGQRVILYQILYTSYFNHVITLYMNHSDPCTVYMSQADIETMLTSHEGFAAVNRGTIVNMNEIRSVKTNELILNNGEMIPISRRRSKEFQQTYDLFRMNQLKKKQRIS